MSHRCGTVALVGRPNVGKSTLINGLTGYKLSIVTPKPQTTRHRILGICTRPEGQILLVDTPGIHRGHKGALNRAMNRTARSALAEVDVVALVVDGQRWTDEDAELAKDIARLGGRRVLVVNKVDRVGDKGLLLPYMQRAQALYSGDAVVPVSARRGQGLEQLAQALIDLLPEAEAVYGEDEITDRSERFLAAEQIREQVLLQLGEEVPYACNVEIESFERGEDELLRIQATIWVEREGQKAIVIGKGGERLKRIGARARQSLEGLFEQRVFLGLWVKHRDNWSDDERALKQFGYLD